MRSERPRERRRAGRRVPAADEPLSKIRLRAGRELTAIDVSDVGLLVEGEMRLLPGTHVDVHLITQDGRLLIRSRVVRAFVCELSPHQIRYRGALAFDRPVRTAAVGYPMPGTLDAPQEGQGSPYPDSAPDRTAVAHERRDCKEFPTGDDVASPLDTARRSPHRGGDDVDVR